MFTQQYPFFVLLASLFSTTLAAPAPPAATVANITAAANAVTLSPVGPIRWPFPLVFTVLSFNYYQDYSCKTPLGSMNISSLDLAANKCFALPGNSLIFTYQQHEGTISPYNPKEVNMHNYQTKGCYKPPTGPTIDGYMGGLGGCFETTSIGSFQAAWGEG